MIKQFFKKFIHDIIKYLNKIPIGHFGGAHAVVLM